ncbi:MAG: oxidoreductase [Bacteroidetes bacterium]|nr:MAG: oxidoreductase [Bacteroidota bacterium]
MKLLSLPTWKDYELIDSGNFEKLERFGKYILWRPEPQAIWDKSLTEKEWEKLAHAKFARINSTKKESLDNGEWQLKKGMPQQWFIEYDYKEMHLKMRLGLTSFKHVGIFPEQANNWNFIYDSVKSLGVQKPKVLNLFSYTGGASLAAKSAGADVSHLDSVKQVVTWARENMEASGLDGIRWIVEDAVKFVKREVTRKNVYHGIMLDPPAYGIGANGERWILEKGINELLKMCSQILDKENSFLVLNLYAMGFSSMIGDNMVSQMFPKPKFKEFGEIYLADQFEKNLPLGTFVRFRMS